MPKDSKIEWTDFTWNNWSLVAEFGYAPRDWAEGSCHSLRVRVGRQDVQVRARQGYCAVKGPDEIAAKVTGRALEQRAGAAAGGVTASARLPYFSAAPNVALVDMAVWHWMYEHPDASPADLKNATVRIAAQTWNRYYAPVFHQRDVVLLGVYSHMIDSFLYLPDYPIGHFIAHQLEEHMRTVGKIGPEVERVARQGRIAPDLWMTGATGAPVGPDALLAATERALNQVAVK